VGFISFTFGARPSAMKVDRPSASWPVSTLRTRQIMRRRCRWRRSSCAPSRQDCGESLKSNSTLKLPDGNPTFRASASLIFLYLLTSEFLTAYTASLSRCGSPSTNTCVITC
jgi:hypothetical protein